MKRFIINGKFLAQPVTGVQRVAREILPELDSIVNGVDVELVVPADAKDVPKLKKIRVIRSKYKKSIFWEQLWLPLYILKHKAIGVHLCHVAPVLKPDIVCIHDANVLRNPQWFTRKVVLWYGFLHRICAKRAKMVLTDSQFSKSELHEVLKIPVDKIRVFVFGFQHLNYIVADENALSKYDLEKGKFYFSLGTRAPHKNMKWVFEYARKHPQETFAVSGFSYGLIYGKESTCAPKNVKFLGYLSDGEIKSLMFNCRAFVFPSFYEGFGIPPLEALSTGCPVIVSDIPVMREIFGNTVHYIDPNCSDVNLDKLLASSVSPAISVLENNSWKRCSEILLATLKECLDS